ncbi:MAG: dihydropteroate synthase-like protein [Candidatus Hodarchaeota archaeon]
MKIWLITGEIAEISLQAILSRFPGIEKIVAPVSVASFISRVTIKKLIDSRPEMRNGIIVIPGMIRWDIDQLQDEIDATLIKGPKNLNNLPGFLKILTKIIESNPRVTREEIIDRIKKEKPSKERMDELYRNIIEERRNIFKNVTTGTATIQHEENKDFAALFKRQFRNFLLPGSDLIVGKDFPPVIMAEIINAPEKDRADVFTTIEYFLKNGAEIIDIGSTPGKLNPEGVGELIKEIIAKFNCPISVDTLNEEEIISGVENGAKVVLSIDQGNKEVLNSLSTETAVVIIPTNIKKGYLPKNPEERILIVQDLISYAQERGFSRIIADPILNSPIVPGLIPSLEAFIKFSQLGIKNPELDLPLFVGGSNVTEMIDTDSTGVNALLGIIGVELGAGILFTTEDSVKCLGSVKEMVNARNLAFQGKLKKTFPKDLSFTAFNFKQKQRAVPLFEIKEEEQDIVDITLLDCKNGYNKDPSGFFFKIMLDHVSGVILAGIFDESGMIKLFKGNNAELMGKNIIQAFSNLSKDHILYLGRELSRAEICLKYNSTYIQDEHEIT